MAKIATRGIDCWKVALLALLIAFSSARADDAMIAEARRERGTVRWYTALNVNGSKPLADAFEKKYPFLKVAINRLSNERIMNRIFAEAKSGAPQFDVTSFAYLPLLAEKGLLARYQSPQTKSYLDGFFDPKGALGDHVLESDRARLQHSPSPRRPGTQGLARFARSALERQAWNGP